MESIRLLEALFDRIKTKYSADDISGPSKDFKAFDLRNKLNKKGSKGGLISPGNIKKERSLSVTSISSNDSILSDKKKSKKKRDTSSSSTSSSSSSSSSIASRNHRKKPTPNNGNSIYPGWMNNPETGEWIPAPQYMYPAPAFFPGMVRPYFNPNYQGGNSNYQSGNSNYQGGYSMRPRGRGRGRGRGYYNNYEADGR